MFACYKQLHPPTAVSFCLKARFTSANDENLIIVKNNIMEVYLIKPNTSNIVLVKVFELFGVIDSIIAVCLQGMKKEMLLINFEDEAKVSVVEFDEKRSDLKTLSLHYLEDDFLREGKARFFHNQPIILDPQNRFATVIICDSKLVILPFRQSGEDVSLSTEDNFLFALSGDQEEANENVGDQKKHHQPEVQRQVIIDLNDLGIKNVKDYCFLNGYNEPTILFLHENEQTWSGRLAAKSNTSTVTAVSFDLFRKYYPKIWSVGSLPHDCNKLIPLQEDVAGGALVIGMNSIIHINQCATYGLSFNDFAVSNPNLSINFNTFDGPALFFDTVAYTFIARDKLLVSLKDGELYTMYLESGGSRINNINIKKTSNTTPASCMCTLKGNLIFLGSKIGDSVLYEYQEKVEVETSSLDTDEEMSSVFAAGENFEPEKKKRKLADDDDFFAALEKDEEPTVIESFSKVSKKETTKVELKIKHVFTNIGPISHLTAAVTSSFDMSGFKSKTNDNQLSAIACSGIGRHGCLTVLNRSLQPDIQSEATLPFLVKQVWTISQKTEHDLYLILSLEDKTKVFESKATLAEVTSKSMFVTNETTLNIGKIRESIVQVTRKSVMLIGSEPKQVHHSKKEIRSSIILDPYVLLHFYDGSLVLLTHDNGRVTSKQLDIESNHGKITAVCLYKTNPEFEFFGINEKEGKYLCCVYWTDGAFEILSVPDMTCVFSFSQFYQFHTTLFDEGQSSNTTQSEVKYPYVTEMALRGIGSDSEMPYLVSVLSDNTVHIYRSFLDRTTKSKDNRLTRLRFSKFQHDDLLPISEIDKKSQTFTLNLKSKYLFPKSDLGRSQLIPFKNIGGYGGLFKTGEKPFWLFTEHSNLRVHPTQSRDPVTTFTPYHHENCPHGFIYLTDKEQDNKKQSKLHISSLNANVKFNAYWPQRKILLKSTPNVITFHQDTNTCLAFTSVPVKAILPDSIPFPEGKCPPPAEQKHTVKLFSGHNWQEMDKFEFDLHESAVAAKVVYLSKEEYNDDTDISFEEPLNSRKQDLVSVVAVGTAYVQSERELCRGRLLLFDLDPILGRENEYKLNLISSTSVKGPITTLEQVDRYIICSVGNRIYTYYFDWEEKRMHITSFYDTQFYTASLNTVRNFIMFGDIYKSVSFLRWKEKGHRLILLAKDNRPLQVVSSEFLVNNDLLGLAVIDTSKNLQIFSYLPQHQESNDGRNLVPVCDFHIGTLINSLIRMKVRELPDDNTIRLGNVNEKPKQSGKKDITKTNPNHQFILFGSVDGAIGYVAPINEVTHRRLFALQLKMYTQLEQAAGLHPKSFRLYKPLERTEYNYKKNIIDGQLIWNYANINTILQRDLARQIGTNSDNILRSIQELNQATFFF
ncbi:CPSF A subunit [Naegleria gruberi]|uniref:CPSF A subunit n=1 Tax=Naegleria gruberi TaxID=5762 RepID=D2VRL0_NAEGR|nr:CPSF A subunit [Naegleria gruberi]EFC40480.1 CPSF A subunit [Naegleria gruberi]|eukprot:XP_002673224.1 CPSF A subunit [Naegleria gruberi]